MDIYIASNNTGKIEEFKSLLDGFKVFAAKQLIKDFNPSETGRSFGQNAIIKAKALAAYAPKNSIIIADDSGLSCKALNGAPGVRSARFASDCGLGAAGDDVANKTALKAALRQLNLSQTKAKFICSLALIKDEQIHCISADLDGIISVQERGINGFGYDSMFYPQGLELSLAELNKEQKNQISHRAKALAKLKEFLAQLKEN